MTNSKPFQNQFISPQLRVAPEPADAPRDRLAQDTGKPRRSVLGRPRALTAAQIAAIIHWHESRVTLQQLADSMGVSTSTVVSALKSRGTHYKQAPPEERAAALDSHRAHCRALREAGFM